MINLLIDRLPDSLNVNGVEYPINTDFRAGIYYELLMQEEDEKAVVEGLKVYYGERIPEDLGAAIEQINWFRNCGRPEKKLTGAGAGNGKQAFSFSCDSDYVYAAFMAQYRIDLTEVEYMHWWKFMALFESLDKESRLMEIMGYRVAKLEGLSKEQRKFYRSMQQYFAIPKSEKEQELKNALDEVLMRGGDPDEVLKR
jgi:hypothetical protein|uniref:Bacteriophage Gp15 protein n=1 Tax=Siphoviridae sp. ctWDo30 TaxID=2826360 RepID=A0A8S5N4T2_9CAUD|nr:MAG TPA: hypothetical protein [Siphoviridae sp. ctWDo30]